MALGKYSRVDGRKPSSGYCSTVTIVVFVALCLVGVWMMTSSSVVPVQNSDVSQENKNEVKTDLSESNTQSTKKSGNNESNNSAIEDNGPNDDGKSKQFEDNPGDLPDDATKGDNNMNSNSEEKTHQRKAGRGETRGSEERR